MKKWMFLLMLALVSFACNKDKDDADNEDYTPSKTIAKVGNYWEGEATADLFKAKGTVISNDNGLAKVEVIVSDISELVPGDIVVQGITIVDGEPIELKGKVSTNTISTFPLGSTDESNPFTLVKFDANVGDTYENTYNGKKTIRTVTDKDFEVEAFGYIIKTMVVEEQVPLGTIKIGDFNISKIRYVTNHRFGFVLVSLYIEGSESFPFVSFYVDNTNCDTKG